MPELSAAENAVFHIVRRVQENPDFSWLMLNTESLFLCFKAIAERKGQSIDDVRKLVEDNAASLREIPEIVKLRKQVAEIEEKEDTDAIKENDFDPVLSEVRELAWQAECGVPLTLEKLNAVLSGKKLANLV